MSTPITNVLYKGRRFQTELEARWAVFFDAVDTQWEYEKEVLELPYGGRVIPDFWLHVQQSWFEIKPELPTEKELVQAADLSFKTRKKVYVVWGQIGEHSIYTFDLPFYEQGYDKRYVFTLSDRSGHLMVASPLRSDDAYQLIGHCHVSQQDILQKADALTNPRLVAAYEAARNATFEVA